MIIESYSLDLEVNFESALIEGNVDIRIKDLGQDYLELDAKDLEIKRVRVDTVVVPFEYVRTDNLLRIVQIPNKGPEHQINVEYTKQISDSAATGVY
jgi:aminopeptidase N